MDDLVGFVDDLVVDLMYLLELHLLVIQLLY